MSEPSVYSVRASSWGELFDCAMRWEGKHLLGMTKPAGMRALVGTALHASSAAFDKGRIDHSGLTADDAADVLIGVLRHPEFDVDMEQDDLSKPEAERIGLTLHAKYCAEISPRFEFRSVEMETKPFQIDCGGGTIVQLTGTMDRSRIIGGQDGGAGIADLKSGGAAVSQGVAKTKGHTAQVGTYELLYEHSTGNRVTVPAVIVGMNTKGRPEVATGEIRNAKLVMTGTTGYRGLIDYASEMFKSGSFPPNPQSMLCGEKFCARFHSCPFHE